MAEYSLVQGSPALAAARPLSGPLPRAHTATWAFIHARTPLATSATTQTIMPSARTAPCCTVSWTLRQTANQAALGWWTRILSSSLRILPALRRQVPLSHTRTSHGMPRVVQPLECRSRTLPTSLEHRRPPLLVCHPECCMVDTKGAVCFHPLSVLSRLDERNDS